jgi:hypothetical protein
VNPLDESASPLANWLALPEQEVWPALLLGTSSDRIGTDHGQAFYATFSKDLEGWTGLPIAPYAGVSYGTFDDELVGIGGLMIRWTERIATYSMWDGHNLHNQLEYDLGHGHAIGLIVVDLDGDYSVGVNWSWNFSMPWERRAEP